MLNFILLWVKRELWLFGNCLNVIITKSHWLNCCIKSSLKIINTCDMYAPFLFLSSSESFFVVFLSGSLSFCKHFYVFKIQLRRIFIFSIQFIFGLYWILVYIEKDVLCTISFVIIYSLNLYFNDVVTVINNVRIVNFLFL